jgi:uncharacterized repeat protein (TIGR02543 family)
MVASLRSAFGGLGSNWNGLTVAMNYTLTYTYNSATGGNTITTSSFTTGDTPITLPTPTRTGYTFGGWHSNSGLTTTIGNAGASYSPTGTTSALSTYAKWTANAYVITYTYNSATAGKSVVSSRFTTGGSAIKLPTPTRTGYTFGGWYSNTGLTAKIGNAGANYSPTGVSLALRAYAKWTSNQATAMVKPTVTGTAKVGKTLTAKDGTWTGSPTPSVTRQWYACSSEVESAASTISSKCKSISGATKSTFKLTSAQKGKYITVLVTGTSSGTPKTSWLAISTGKVG